MARLPPPPRADRAGLGKRRRSTEWDEDMPGDSRSPSRPREVRRQSSRLIERDRDARTSRSRSPPQRRVILPGRGSRSRSRGSRSPSRRGPRGRPQGRSAPQLRGALPRRRVVAPDDGGWGRRGSGLTLTPAAGANRRGASDEEFGPRRRYDGRRSEREEDDGWKRPDPERSKKYRLRLEDWILAVNLLLSWDDQKTISAADMEEFLSRFLEYDAKVKYRITPRLTSEIFLRGILRTLWDIDRLLRVMNPGEELKMVTAKSPLVLSILRVMAYEFMWTPNCAARGAKEGARDLMERVSLSVKADRDWITDAMIRMGEAFEKAHNDWDKKHAAAKEKKRRQRADKAARAAGGGDLAAGGAKVKLAENAKAKAARKREGEDPRAKRKGADAHFGNARALAAKEQALGKADQAADSQKSARGNSAAVRSSVVRPAAAHEDEDHEDEDGDGHGAGGNQGTLETAVVSNAPVRMADEEVDEDAGDEEDAEPDVEGEEPEAAEREVEDAEEDAEAKDAGVAEAEATPVEPEEDGKKDLDPADNGVEREEET
ncbi:unnamed protein product [Durusdinium trenchii]|uniref:Uncharacterized protein n=2 Tax=Durusdinium trenchii TaxID=1381693 RepID=A0ABP0I5F6_9DINO